MISQSTTASAVEPLRAKAAQNTGANEHSRPSRWDDPGYRARAKTLRSAVDDYVAGARNDQTALMSPSSVGQIGVTQPLERKRIIEAATATAMHAYARNRDGQNSIDQMLLFFISVRSDNNFGRCAESLQAMAAFVCVDVRTVRRRIGVLKQAGLVHCEERVGQTTATWLPYTKAIVISSRVSGETFWKFVSDEATRISSLGNLAQVVTAVVAGIALGFAYGQLRASRSAQREATLDELNRDQNALSLQHPRFANPRLGTVYPEARTFDGDPVLFEQYYRFVTIGLVVCDHAVRDGRTGDWKNAVNRYLEDHCQTLGSTFFERDWPEYSDELYARWSAVRERIEKTGSMFSGRKQKHVGPA